MNLRLALWAWATAVLLALTDPDWFNPSQFWTLTSLHHEQIAVAFGLLGFGFLAVPRKQYDLRAFLVLFASVAIILTVIIVLATPT